MLIGGTGEKSYEDDTLPICIDGVTDVIIATTWSCGGNVQGISSRHLTVTFGSAGPGAMWFAKSKRSGEEGGVSAQTSRTCDAARADAYRVPPALHT